MLHQKRMQKVWQPAQMQAPELMFPGETTDKVLPAMPSRLSKLYFVIVVIQADVFFQDVVPLLLRLQNASYMKSVNENWSIQKNRRERRFFEKMCFLSVGTFVDFYEMIPWLAITRATLISTRTARAGNRGLICVNALTRATLISTYNT